MSFVATSTTSDDDVLLDTGVSFPIGFEKARIFGEEVSLQVSALVAFFRYFELFESGGLRPGTVTAGFFLGDDASGARRRHRVLLSRSTREIRFARACGCNPRSERGLLSAEITEAACRWSSTQAT